MRDGGDVLVPHDLHLPTGNLTLLELILCGVVTRPGIQEFLLRFTFCNCQHLFQARGAIWRSANDNSAVKRPGVRYDVTRDTDATAASDCGRHQLLNLLQHHRRRCNSLQRSFNAEVLVARPPFTNDHAVDV